MGAGKLLNTSNALYSNIVRALSGDVYKSKLVALKGGADTPEQTQHSFINESASTWVAVQGIARDANNWFATDTAEIRKYDLSNNLLVTNSSPFTGLPAGMNHCGDGFVGGAFLYVPVTNWNGSISLDVVIAKYNIANLTLDSYIHTYATTPAFGGAGICKSKNGTEILGVSFYSVAGSDPRNTDIHRFDINTGLPVGIHQLDVPSVGNQSIAYHPKTDGYYIGSFNPSGVSSIYVSNASFEHQSNLDPINSNTEMEGVESYDGVLYYHTISGDARIAKIDNLYISSFTAQNEPVNFLPNPLISDDFTILLRMTPENLFNYNSVIDSQEYDNHWESWIYSDGRVAWRVNSSHSIISSSSTAQSGVEMLIAYTASNSGGTVTTKLNINGLPKGTTSGSWVTPPTNGLWFNGENTGNNQGDNTFNDVIVFDKVLSDAELLDAYNNFNDFYVEEGGGSAIDVTATLGAISYTSSDPSVSVTGSVDVDATLGGIEYSSSSAIISLTGEFVVSAGLGVINYTSSDATVSLAAEITINTTLGNINYTSSNATVELAGVIPVAATLGSIIYGDYSATVSIGEGQFISNVTVEYANDIYTAGFKPDTITVKFN